MARLAAALALLTIVTAAPVQAQTEDQDELHAVADEAGVDVTDLAGAVSSQPGVTAREYLIFEGLLRRPVAKPTGRLACIARAESHNDPGATNPRSGAMGLFQFMPSTWRSTPQGRAGLSAYDPAAATAAAEWMVSQGRVREWSVVSMGICP